MIEIHIFFTGEDDEGSDYSMDIEAIFVREDVHIKEEPLEFSDVSWYYYEWAKRTKFLLAVIYKVIE